MTESKKNKINRLSDKAIDLFLKHRNICQELEKELEKISKVEIQDILYQMSDGLVVEIPYDNWDGHTPINVPIEQFLQEYVK